MRLIWLTVNACRRLLAMARGMAARGVVAVACGLVAPGLAVAGPRACAAVRDPVHKSAIAAAEAWRVARWAPSGKGWTTTYTVKPEAPLPLGIGTFVRGLELLGVPTITGSIAGVAEISGVRCTTYETGPQRSFVVRFTGLRLRFSEGGGPWSRALPAALIHVVEVRPGAADGARQEPGVREMTDARTAFIPGSQLTRPATALAPTGAPTRATAPAGRAKSGSRR